MVDQQIALSPRSKVGGLNPSQGPLFSLCLGEGFYQALCPAVQEQACLWMTGDSELPLNLNARVMCVCVSYDVSPAFALCAGDRYQQTPVTLLRYKVAEIMDCDFHPHLLSSEMTSKLESWCTEVCDRRLFPTSLEVPPTLSTACPFRAGGSEAQKKQ